MNHTVKLKNIRLVVASEFRKWICNPKMLIFLVAFLPLRDTAIKPLIQASDYMNSPLNLVEGCISVLNLGLLPLAFIYLVLISSFPTTDENMMFYISRMGRRNWIAGEVCFQILAAIVYGVVTVAIAAVQMLPYSFLANGWSIVVTEYDSITPIEMPKLDHVLPPNLYFQLSPYKCLLLSFFMFVLLLIVCGMTFLVGCLYRRRLELFIFTSIHLVVGVGMIFLNSMMMWITPLAHARLAWHYDEYLRKYVFPPDWSILILSGIVIIAVVVAWHKAKRVSIDLIGGDLFS